MSSRRAQVKQPTLFGQPERRDELEGIKQDRRRARFINCPSPGCRHLVAPDSKRCAWCGARLKQQGEVRSE